MDYFLPSCKTHISPIPGKFPVDVERWQACVRGTGDETQSWTAARDVGRVVVELSRADSWVGSFIRARKRGGGNSLREVSGRKRMRCGLTRSIPDLGASHLRSRRVEHV